MDGFSYYNIFATKGIEYIAIIAFLLLLIPFWIVLHHPVQSLRPIREALSRLTANILNIPQGLFYSKNHAWTYLEPSGTAKVGLDDLLLKIVGPVQVQYLREPGEFILKGEPMTIIRQKGKSLRIPAPVSGTLTDTNPMVVQESGILNEDPYDRGWLCRIKPADWVTETRSYYLAEEATQWATRELIRLKDFLAVSLQKNAVDPSMVVLQEGGELRMNPLSELQPEVWQDFQQEFLSQP
ncbi:MAG: hypothetical protein JXR71_04180 [Bacteroidales bacterium]|nr:hypothetical protein [Bacteroidales bacterium]